MHHCNRCKILEIFNSYDIYVTNTHNTNETSLKVPNTPLIFVENIEKKSSYIYYTKIKCNKF